MGQALSIVRAAAEPEAPDLITQTLLLMQKLKFGFDADDLDWNLKNVTKETPSKIVVGMRHNFGVDGAAEVLYGIEVYVKKHSFVIYPVEKSHWLVRRYGIVARSYPYPRTGKEAVNILLNRIVSDFGGENVRINGQPLHLQAKAAVEPTGTDKLSTLFQKLVSQLHRRLGSTRKLVQVQGYNVAVGTGLGGLCLSVELDGKYNQFLSSVREDDRYLGIRKRKTVIEIRHTNADFRVDIDHAQDVDSLFRDILVKYVENVQEATASATAAAEPAPVLVLTKREIERWVFSRHKLKIQGTNVEMYNTHHSSAGNVVLEVHQYADGADGSSTNYAFMHLRWSRAKSVTTLDVRVVRHDTAEYEKTYNVKHVSLEKLLNLVFSDYFRSREGKIFLTNDVDTQERHRLQKIRDAHQARAATEPGVELTGSRLQDLLLNVITGGRRVVLADGSDRQWRLSYVELRNSESHVVHVGFTLQGVLKRTLQFFIISFDADHLYICVDKKQKPKQAEVLTVTCPDNDSSLIRVILETLQKLMRERIQAAPDKAEAAVEPDTLDVKSLLKFLHGPFFTTTAGNTTLHFNRHTFGQRVVELQNRNMYRIVEFWNQGTSSHDPAGLAVSFYGHGRDERKIDQYGEPEDMESECIRTWSNQQDLIQQVIRIILKKERKRGHEGHEPVHAAAEPTPGFDPDALARDLNQHQLPRYYGKCNPKVEVQARFFEHDDDQEKYGFIQYAFEIAVTPEDEDEHIGEAFVNVRVYADRITIESTRPTIGTEWYKVMYAKTLQRPELLTARFLVQLLDRELRRTNYYENFARWASDLKPVEMKL